MASLELFTTIFSDWDFFTGADPTHGSVRYRSKTDATSKGLAVVQEDGTTVLAVDDNTQLPVGEKRDSYVHSPSNAILAFA